MRAWIAGIVLPLVAVGCESKGAATGKEFLAKFQQAEKSKDSAAVWNLISKESREKQLAEVRKEVEEAKGKPEAIEEMKKKYGLTENPTEMPGEKLAQVRLGKRLESKPSDLLNAKFIEEKPQGEDRVVLVLEVSGKGKREITLVREEGGLRLKLEATS